MLQRLKILILLLFISISGISQTSSLKNGFVAATDSLVYYLQDGFSEWVMFDVNGSYQNFSDSIASVSFNGEKTMILEKGNKNDGYTNRYIYGNKTYQYIGGSGIGDFEKNSLETKSKFGMFCIYYVYIPLYSNTYIEYRIGGIGGSLGEELFSSSHATSISGDSDSTYCVVGKNNTMKKMLINSDSSNIFTSVSGLHSRSIDSHKICYNPDDDEFIIVSDSGIVYTYDKTTLTTLDTLLYITSIDDICYGNGYFYIINKYPYAGNYGITIIVTSNFENYNNTIGYVGVVDVESSCIYSKNINKTAVCFYNFQGNTTFRYVDSLANVTNGVSLDDVSIFDLDYINNE